jgi:hypothetical protein
MIKKDLWSKKVESLKDLNFEARDKTILVENLDESILFKAEVIGVKGIICLNNESSSESEIEIKKIDKDEWKKLR